jgi:hypothetical protein
MKQRPPTKGVRETLRPRSHVIEGPCDHKGPPRAPPTSGSISRLPFFIATWINCPHDYIPNFDQTRTLFFLVANGRPAQNGRPFPLFKSLTQYGLLTVPTFLAQPGKWTRPKDFNYLINLLRRSFKNLPTLLSIPTSPELIGITKRNTCQTLLVVGKIILPEFPRAKRRRHTRFAPVATHLRFVNLYAAWL